MLIRPNLSVNACPFYNLLCLCLILCGPVSSRMVVVGLCLSYFIFLFINCFVHKTGRVFFYRCIFSPIVMSGIRLLPIWLMVCSLVDVLVRWPSELYILTSTSFGLWLKDLLGYAYITITAIFRFERLPYEFHIFSKKGINSMVYEFSQ